MRHLSLILILSFACGQALAQSSIKTTLVKGPGRDRLEGPAMICDGKTNTKWCVDIPREMPYTIILDAGQQTNIAEYGFTTGDDTSMYPERNPITWRVSGSNDKETWQTIDDQKNNHSLPAENEQEYRFRPTAAGAKSEFRYFRFEFFRLAGGTRIQLSEISLYNTIQTPVKATFVSGSGQATKEGAAMVCDGRLYTKWCIDEPRQMPYTVILDAGSQTPVSEYRFWTGDDTHSYPDRNPVSWRVSGSNDKETWTTLDEQKGNRRLRDENEQEYRFKPAVIGQYRYYRFEFIRMTNGTRFQLSEIRLYK
ncbi:MAG: discoidin domain-containing protein [Prevotellaceae bacterium]|nr:discoidin domain-containing protein [Prevotellaceae bacterium]